MNEIGMKNRAQGSIAGLSIGDALGRPVEGFTPREIQEKWGRVEGYVSDDPLGSDDTEYALLTALALITHPKSFNANNIAKLWVDKVCNQRGGFGGGGFSEMLAIRNLSRGFMPPRSGQHSHAWSDGLAMRVAPIGVVAAGDPKHAAALTLQDGLVSHSEEGIYAGQAIAAAVASAMVGNSIDRIFSDALSVVEPDSWTARLMKRADELVSSSNNWNDLAIKAGDELTCMDYYWADLAPEAVSLSFVAFLGGEGDFSSSVLNAVNLGRDADTIAAMTAGIVGAMTGIDGIPEEWLPAVAEAPGVCLHVTKGMNPLDIADSLAELAESGVQI
ncbi:MAG: ADP-ribosylglycohydrolase family protein [Aquiluna sp.]|nr:ADP-ribosylglycohydrolase family protein [Aquiluna sp.]